MPEEGSSLFCSRWSIIMSWRKTTFPLDHCHFECHDRDHLPAINVQKRPYMCISTVSFLLIITARKFKYWKLIFWNNSTLLKIWTKKLENQVGKQINFCYEISKILKLFRLVNMYAKYLLPLQRNIILHNLAWT